MGMFDILATGLTVGGWFNSDTAQAGDIGLISKYNSTDNRSYMLYLNDSVPEFCVSSDGAAVTTVTSDYVMDNDYWFFLAGRWTPSTELSVFVNGNITTNTTSIPASIFKSSIALKIGAVDTAYFDGKGSLCFVCKYALPDILIKSIYETTKPMFRLTDDTVYYTP